MTTFDYLTRVFIDSLSRFENAHEKAFLGVATCSVVEFLGRCIRNQGCHTDGYKDFLQFINDYLSKKDRRYKDYGHILYKDLRHGSAHSVLPKGGVVLSFDSSSSHLHLSLVRDKNSKNYYVWIYSPKLLNDLKDSIFKFVEDARQNKVLENNYIQILRYLHLEGQNILRKNLSKKNFDSAIEEDIKGDIAV